MRCPNVVEVSGVVDKVDGIHSSSSWMHEECHYRFTTWAWTSGRTDPGRLLKGMRNTSTRDKIHGGYPLGTKTTLYPVMQNRRNCKPDRAKGSQPKPIMKLTVSVLFLLDELADLRSHVRFVSVYRSFKDVGELYISLWINQWRNQEEKGKIDEAQYPSSFLKITFPPA